MKKGRKTEKRKQKTKEKKGKMKSESTIERMKVCRMCNNKKCLINPFILRVYLGFA